MLDFDGNCSTVDVGVQHNPPRTVLHYIPTRRRVGNPPPPFWVDLQQKPPGCEAELGSRPDVAGKQSFRT
jgi:hypothetical protein